MSVNGQQVFLQGLSAVTATRGLGDPQLGDVRVEGNRHYRYVYNAADTQVQPGYAMCVLAPSSTGYSGTISTAAGVPILGVVRHATITTNAYGWVVFKGVCQVTASATVSAGDVIAIGDNGLFATAATATSVLVHADGIAVINSDTVTGASGGAALYGVA